ncbi:MAG: hypothetical protein Q4B62_05630 [Clostridiaceae bacterium]|nr:hypothetical protein [Clostridiaceae bacterium]
MNKHLIKSLFAVIITLSVAVLISACNSEIADETTASDFSAQSDKSVSETVKGSVIHSVADDVTASSSFENSEVTASATKSVTVTAKPEKTEPNNTSITASQVVIEKTTKGEKIGEISKGISLLTKTSPVAVGNSATVMIQGIPDKKYTIEFYETPSRRAESKDLAAKTADINGFVTWTFPIESSCEKGDRKVIIRENGSANFIQTSITIV